RSPDPIVARSPDRATRGGQEPGDSERLPSPRPLNAGPAGDLKQEPPPVLSAARNAVARGDLKQGIARFEEYLAQFPNDYAVRKEYAGVLVQAAQRAKALQQYQ